MSEFNLNIPINSVSFGQISVLLLREIFNRQLSPCIFPIGNVDVSSQKIDKEFGLWLQTCINKSLSTWKRNTPVIRLWHINGSHESVGSKQFLINFHETDSLTPIECNILRNQEKILVFSNYTKNVIEDHGIKTVYFIPPAFDTYNFQRKEKQYFTDGRITFNIAGKFEHRKGHAKCIRAWLAKYGNDTRYFLNCAIYNPFLSPEQNNSIFNQIVDGKRYSNIQFLGFMPTNETFNDFLNSGDIIIGMGTEEIDLPAFQSVGIGKHAVILNAAGHKTWATETNSCLVEPDSKVPCYDNMFFQKDTPFNQGNFYNFSEESFIDGCERAIKRVNDNRLNVDGLKLPEQFPVSKTLDFILNNL